jgi:hypothetical protein
MTHFPIRVLVLPRKYHGTSSRPNVDARSGGGGGLSWVHEVACRCGPDPRFQETRSYRKEEVFTCDHVTSGIIYVRVGCSVQYHSNLARSFLESWATKYDAFSYSENARVVYSPVSFDLRSWNKATSLRGHGVHAPPFVKTRKLIKHIPKRSSIRKLNCAI